MYQGQKQQLVLEKVLCGMLHNLLSAPHRPEQLLDPSAPLLR